MKMLISAAAAILFIPPMAQAQDAAVKNYIDGAFVAMDGNADGKVDRAEFEAFMQARLARQAAAFDQAFKDLDTSGDGQIDKTEAAANPALAKGFDDVDTDGNDAISKEEARAAIIAAHAKEAGAQ